MRDDDFGGRLVEEICEVGLCLLVLNKFFLIAIELKVCPRIDRLPNR